MRRQRPIQCLSCTVCSERMDCIARREGLGGWAFSTYVFFPPSALLENWVGWVGMPISGKWMAGRVGRMLQKNPGSVSGCVTRM